jgi:hypothetical protein
MIITPLRRWGDFQPMFYDALCPIVTRVEAQPVRTQLYGLRIAVLRAMLDRETHIELSL